MQRDTLVGIAWAVGLLLLMGGVFAYEVATFELDDYRFEHGEAVVVQSGGATLQEGASKTYSFIVPDNVTSVTAAVTWSDGEGDADTFDVLLAGPGGSPSSAGTGASGVSVSWAQSLPEPVGAVDAAHAIEQAELAGLGGEWTVVVTLSDAPGTTLPVGGTEIQADGSEDFTIEVSYRTIAAVPA